MTDQFVSSHADLLAEIEQKWTLLNAALDRLTPSQMTTIQDAEGWTVKDHIVHLARWERSVVSFLQHEPRHLGLGIDEDLYLRGDEDAINAAIYQQTRALSFDIARADLQETHAQLLELLASLADDDLQKSYRDYLPDEPGEGDGPPAFNVIYGNTANHYTEHLAWIQALVSE